MFDFELLKQSTFWQKGCHRFYWNNEKKIVEPVKKDFLFLSSNSTIPNVITRAPYHNNGVNYILCLLDLSSEIHNNNLDSEIRDTIISQCNEINSLIQTLEHCPVQSFFFIVPENNIILPHTHGYATKHTITFFYNYNYNVNNNNTVEINNKKYIFPSESKLILNMYDDPMHSVYIESGWSFIWAYDFLTKIDIPKIFYDKFTSIT